MGAQQVLRAAGVVAAVAIAAAPSGAHADRAPRLRLAQAGADPAGAEAVIVVDLRPGDPAALVTSRKALLDELDAIQGIRARRDPELEGALSGAAVDRDAARVSAALDEARTAFGALDCKRAAPAADRAIDDLAARQAAGLDDGAALRTAYAYLLLCADQAGDTATTVRAASRLRALGVTSGDDVGISATTWAKLPEIDASTGDLVALTVEADQPGAAVWVDHVAVGPAPQTVIVAGGEHVVAAGVGGTRAAKRLEVHGTKQTVALALTDQRGSWSDIAGKVRAWRDQVQSPTNAELGAIMTTAEVRFAVVLAGSRTAEVWAQGPTDPVAKKLDTGTIDQPLELAAMISDRAAVWDGRAPGDELLTETAEERARLYGTGKRDSAKWYVYASIAGAILVGGAVIYFNDSASDTQRIVIQGP
jgi:hypothetical protein